MAFSRVDQVINFTWGYGRLTEYATDFVSIRWEGAVLADYTEDYTFTLVADDSVRLWIDHDLVIDQWHVQLAGRNVSGAAPLTAGQLHHIILEYREVSHDAFVSLFWQSANTKQQIIPQSRLYHLHELDESPKEVEVVSAETLASTSDCVGVSEFFYIAWFGLVWFGLVVMLVSQYLSFFFSQFLVGQSVNRNSILNFCFDLSTTRPTPITLLMQSHP